MACLVNYTLYNNSSDNGLSSLKHQTIIWTNAGFLLIASIHTDTAQISMKFESKYKIASVQTSL